MGELSEKYLIAMEKQREKNKEKFFQKCKERNGDTIDLSKYVYGGVDVYGICVCKICGYEWEERPEILVKRKLCPECHAKNKFLRNREKNIIKYTETANVIYKDKKITDIKFFYNEKNVLMVSYFCNEIGCNGEKHGQHIQDGKFFLKGHGCPKCANHPSRAYTTEEWVIMAKNKYPEFSYEKSVYVNKVTKVIVTCPKHGDFNINPKDFMSGRLYCPKCTKERLHNDFVNRVIEKAKKVHENEDYIYHPELIYNSYENMGIECKKHGIFWQSINNHIVGKSRCPQCAIEYTLMNNKKKKEKYNEIFIERSNLIHNNKYNYEKCVYNGNENKVIITCPEHGDFKQTPHSHLAGGGCPVCAKIKTGESIRLSQEEFMGRIKKIHKNEGYDFSKVVYNGCENKVIVGCPKHGEFKIRALSLLLGCGCPICRMPKLEKEVRDILIDNNINFTPQKRFKKWLGGQSLDFYLPEHNIGIECQGIQHFKNDKRYNKLEEVQTRDERKKQLCKDNNVHLIYYLPPVFAEYMSDDDIYFTDVNELVDYIKNYKLNG